jgi:predicted DNA-binding protein
MQTVTFQISENIIEKLHALSKSLRKDKDIIISQAIESYIEDIEDCNRAMEILANENPAERVSLEEMMKKYGLEN